MITRKEKRYGVLLPVKIGTMPRSCVWLKPIEGGWKVGARTQYREDVRGSRWEDVMIWQIGPEPENFLYLEYV
jgi:hypothetical protein